MTLTPLIRAAPVIQLHAAAALAALGVGIVQLAAPKGTARHRALGYTWVVLMALLALSSFGIRSLWPGRYSPIHLLSVFTLAMLPIAVLHARGGRVVAHRVAMLSIFFGALVIAGAFTLLPERIMGRVVFGP